MDKEKLYDAIDAEDDITDQEKRAAYFGAIAEEQAESDWQDQQSGF